MSSDRPSDAPSAAPDPAAALLDALGRHAPPVLEHAEATGTYSFATAAELGLSRGDCELARDAARLHEVGHVYAAADEAPGGHQEEAYRLLHGAAIDETTCDWVLNARERFDGTGPAGLAGEAIPIGSRLVRATCVFHLALTEGGHDHAIDRIAAEAGSELDPRVVAALATVVQRASA